MAEKQYSTVTSVLGWNDPSNPYIITVSSTEIETEDPTVEEVVNELGENGWVLKESVTFPVFNGDGDRTGQIISYVLERDTDEFQAHGGVIAFGHTWR